MADSARRHLAAILCGDVVGSSRLMAKDTDTTVSQLGDSRERIGRLVEKRSGRLVDFSGDAFLAECPSALDAVRCALDVTSALEERDAAVPAERRMR